MSAYQYIRSLADLTIDDVPLVGGKNASLGEMYRGLSSQGIKVPNGFATTARAYRDYLDHNNLTEKITEALATLDIRDVDQLAEVGAQIRSWIVYGDLQPKLKEEITMAYQAMEQEYGDHTDVAVRSSATAEDLPDASFAGQQETYLNVCGIERLLRTSKRVFASLYTDRAISYRVDKGFEHMSVALSIGVQKMVRSDRATSGVIFTLDTESGFRDVVMITAAYGLGENVVQGAVNPDEYLVYKNTLDGGHKPIVRRNLGEKAIKMIYAKGAVTGTGGAATTNVHVRRAERERFALNDDEILQLAQYAIVIEKHYSDRAGKPRPMDIEWAKDGDSGELFIVQARPETVHSVKSGAIQEVFSLEQRGKVLAQGKSVGGRIGTGRARIILEASYMNELQPGEVLVTDMTDPDWEPVMKIASAIITNRGGRVCHAAIIARELGIPAVVGSGSATHDIPDETDVTVSCAEGDVGYVYNGILPFTKEEVDFGDLKRPNTHIMLIVGDPSQAFYFAQLPNDGVGLARVEFIISNSIGIHPAALLNFDSLDDSLKRKIQNRIAGYDDPRSFYIDKLAEGVGAIAAAFYPKPVIVRMSDFKSNEYAQLLGGLMYEPKEENPMIGFRGASRYYSESFTEPFGLECLAMKKVREEMGLTNLEVMIPFVRTVNEAKQVIKVMAQHGLKRGENGLKVNLMCEIPANALFADQFLEISDGFSIGSNDLTQLTLGVDRDSGLLTQFDERDPAVHELMGMAIRACRKAGKYIGICGQAPSDFPEITRWLVEQGIESIALNPDSVLKMTRIVLDVEAEREQSKAAS
ncbi:MAG: phosphoenolpyruvate synthase [Gammaproteobacteria bacterium]|nr:MAG: phosphoenolpyruvate synthase [Gammaproteobacteria bacterium]